MLKLNRPTSVQKQLSLTNAVLGGTCQQGGIDVGNEITKSSRNSPLIVYV